MAIPAGITTATVTVGPVVSFQGTVATLVVQVEPILGLGGEATALEHTPSGTTFGRFREPVRSQADGVVALQLPHVDQAGFVDGTGASATMWAYRVAVRAEGVGLTPLTFTTDFQVMAGQELVDLNLLEQGVVTEPVSAPAPVVESVNGATGHVLLPELVVVLTQAEYDALATKDPATLYAITGP